MDNPKVKRGINEFGACLIAADDIAKDEFLAEFDGLVYEAQRCTDLPKDVADHAIQFEEHKWRDSSGVARLINHSCDPNCRIVDLFKLVAKKNIAKGEELTWDYGMTEDSDWRMECRRNEPNCRKLIGNFALVPESVRKARKYEMSGWLVKKYSS